MTLFLPASVPHWNAGSLCVSGLPAFRLELHHAPSQFSGFWTWTENYPISYPGSLTCWLYVTEPARLHSCASKFLIIKHTCILLILFLWETLSNIFATRFCPLINFPTITIATTLVQGTQSLHLGTAILLNWLPLWLAVRCPGLESLGKEIFNFFNSCWFIHVPNFFSSQIW